MYIISYIEIYVYINNKTDYTFIKLQKIEVFTKHKNCRHIYNLFTYKYL